MAATTDADTEFFETDPESPETDEGVPTEEEGDIGPEPVDPENLGEDPADAELSDDARRARWQSRRPRIDHLKDAVTVTEVDGETLTLPLFDVGDRIVVDRRTTLLRGEPWLETIVGKVRSIDDDTGMVTMFDESTDPRMMSVRYVCFKDSLHIFKLAPAKGNPFTATAVRQAAKPEPKPGDPPKRGRGRPKGAKNRPKEVIEAEKEAYRKMKEDKKKKR